MTGFPHDPNLAKSHRQQQPLVGRSSRSNRDKEELATAEFFSHCDNRPRKQNPLQNSSPTVTIIHNFCIITTLIAELLHSLLSLCIFLQGIKKKKKQRSGHRDNHLQLLHYHNPNCKTPTQSFEQQPLVDRSSRNNHDKEELATVEFFPHRDN